MYQRLAVSAGIAMLMQSLSAHAAEPALPALDLQLTPHTVGGTVDGIDVQVRVQEPKVEAGKALLRMPTFVASTPTAAYPAEALHASDASGPLKLTVFDEASTPTGNYRQYQVDRATVGDVTVHYTGKPREVNAQTRNGPLFDLRTQGGGALGAGVYFLALPPGEQPYKLSVKWDLSKLPAGARGVWSLGEGEQHTVGTAEMLAFSAYAMGPVKSEPEDGKGNFGLYWLQEPPFDMPKLAADTKKLYRYMANFFHDPDSSYRVFARQNPYPAGGGTGLAKSFMFGYGPGGETASGGDQQMLLAHEMAHNWPRLNGDESHSDTAWYTEGTAEYYSTSLAYRAGAISLDKYLVNVNERAANYAGNPYKSLSNTESGKIFWSDARAQRVPYGRGFMYFVRLNAEIVKKSGGKRSLDNLVLEVLKRQKANEKVGLPQWRALVVKELGAVAGTEFDDMAAGKDIVPQKDSLGACLTAVSYTVRPFDLGFDEMSLGVVKNLRKESAAAAAGVHEGDKILSLPALKEAREKEGKELAVELQRGDEKLSVNYLPRGAGVTAWRWERTPAAAKGNCKL
jgi:hypothetical protein